MACLPSSDQFIERFKITLAKAPNHVMKSSSEFCNLKLHSVIWLFLALFSSFLYLYAFRNLPSNFHSFLKYFTLSFFFYHNFPELNKTRKKFSSHWPLFRSIEKSPRWIPRLWDFAGQVYRVLSNTEEFWP